MLDKVFLVTGASGAIGLATSIELAKTGAKVVMAGRNQGRLNRAMETVRVAAKSDALDTLVLDLSDTQRVRKAAGAFRDEYKKLHLLVNCAAVFTGKRETGQGGYERMFATNHLGPFLLTNLLLPQLRAAQGARVINVTAPTTTPVDFEDVHGDKSFSALRAFGASKMGNLLFTFALARRYDGKGIVVHAMHPGLVKSTLVAEMNWPMRTMLNLFSGPPDEAGKALFALGTAPEFGESTGKFYKLTTEIKAAPFALDQGNQEELWRLSKRLVGLAGDETGVIDRGSLT